MADLDRADFALDEMPGRVLHDVLRGYRERGPVQPTRFFTMPAFVITSYEALLEAFRDDERFPPHRMYETSLEGVVGKSFISMQEPDHLRFRRLAMPAFRSRAVERFVARGLVELAAELADALQGRGELDLIADFAERLPYLVIARMLGLPRDREDAFHRWSLAMLRWRDDPATGARAAEELTRFLAPVVEARRREPRDDVISELLAAEVDDRRLGDDEVYSHVRLLLPTGGETTHGSLGNLLYALLTHDGAWASLREAPAKIPDAVDELLRWESPIAVLPRMSHPDEEVEFGGVRMPPNSWVLFACAGANRDPAKYADPDRFDVARDNRDTLTFGRGVKACPGMHLARRSMAVATQALLERFPQLELVDPDAALPRRTVLRSPAALRVKAAARV